ncbi:MAG TPA: phosphatidate cytidylyltransferase [Blastocatellia bacterium]|nr:phosphatidate cytidylyltransferase [Blastocatellia bacterium]
MKRILTALIALPILLYTVWNDFPYIFIAIAVLAVLAGLYEFYSLAEKAGCRPAQVPGYAAALVVIAAFVYESPALIAAALTAVAGAALALEVFRADDMKQSLASVSATVFGVVYIALLLGFLVGVRMTPDSLSAPATPKVAAKLLTMFFAMVMMTDTGAYYTGRSIGRHKLAPRVSPGKTIEGSIGGFVAASLAGLASKYIFFPEIPALHVLLLGAVVGIVGQIGDLAESLLKRGSQVKDSGNIFPGHGGMLDRIDSILFCAPLIYYYSRFLFPKS